MSMYDNFRAPQYVDFLNIQNNDTGSDASAFFNSALEMDSSLKLRGTENSQLSSFSDFSDNETTLTPTAALSQTFEGVNQSTLTPNTPIADHNNCEAVSSEISGSATPQNPSKFQSPRSANTPIRSALNKSRGRSGLKVDLGPPKKVNWVFGQSKESDKSIESNIIAKGETGKKISGENTTETCNSDTLLTVTVNVIPPSPINLGCALDTSTPLICSATVPKVGLSSGKSASKQKRRSRSAGPPKSPTKDEEELLLNALGTLKLSGSKSGRASIISSLNQSISPQVVSNFAPSMKTPKKEELNVEDKPRPKRKISPGSRHIRDSCQQPEKFISMAEHIARIQKTTPTRFRSAPKPATQKQAVQSKIARNNIRLHQKGPVTTQKTNAANEIPGTSNSSELQQVRIKAGDRGVKVARHESPKVEPFKFTDQPGLPKTIFNFDKKDKLLLRDRRTPMKRLIPTTKVVPFSFDKRDQEIIKRKVERVKGVAAESVQCAKPAVRQRSKSHSGAISAGTGELRHARVPVVLYKAPFLPQLPQHKPTIPIPIQLSTQRRAKEREEFEEHLRKKEELRSAALHQLQEKRRLEEEREIQHLRKELVHKAHPMPVYHKFKVKPSTAPLTSPHSPSFNHRPPIKMNVKTADGSSHNSSNNDEPMEC